MINSRDKGAKGERELAARLREYGYDSKRGCQYKGSPDSPDVTGLYGVHIECKRTERLSLYDALSQSKRDAGKDEMPVVMHRKNNCAWVVIQPLEDWIEIYKSWETENEVK